MSSMKCPQCGLVNWSTSENCKRCGTAVHAEYESWKPTEVETDQPKTEPLFSGGVKVLTAILGLTIIVLAVQRAFNIMDESTANGIAVVFVLSGLALLTISHLWLLVRIFQQSTSWGLGALFIPVVGLIAVGRFWEKTKRSFVGLLICCGIVFAGSMIVV